MKMKTSLMVIAIAMNYFSYAQQQLTGSIDGVFDVSNLGAATYTIPVSVPDGIGGMKPSINISYNSQNQANGNLGIGWSVSGTSVITRAGSTILLNGKTAGATLGSDKFALDGSRLVRTGDLNSTSNYTYATESESFLKVEGQNTGSDFQSFKVTDQSGVFSEYGISANSKQNMGSLTYAWMLARQTDLNGNSVNYEYYNVAGEEVRLKAITYGGGSTPLNRVTFHYINKAVQNFVYLLGQKLDSKYKLDRITIESTGGTGNVYSLLYTYQFEYATQKDQLLRVRHISNFTNQEIPATNFHYENPAPPELSSIMALDALSNKEEIIVGDFNGDGKSDFILYDNDLSNSNSAGLLHLNNGANDFPIIQGIPIPKVPEHYIEARYHYDRLNRSSFFDFNGDGREDLYTLYPHFSIGNSPTETTNDYSVLISELNSAYPGGIQLVEKEKIEGGTGGNSYFYATFPVVGDFDGDGLSEILILNKSNSSDLRNYILGLKYSPILGPANDPYRRGAFLPNMPFDAREIEAAGQWDRSKIFAIDYNGDGKNEILFIRQGLAKIYELNVTFDANLNPVIASPAFVEVSSDGYPTSAHEVFMGDFNGDGLSDMLTYVDGAGWEIGYGKGNGKFNDIRSIGNVGINKPGCFYSSPAVLVGDFNGDGKADIFDAADPASSGASCFGYGARIHFSKGNHSFETKNYSINTNQIAYGSRMIKLGDFNGDGSVDLISRKALHSNDDFYIHKFRPFDDTKLLTKVVNGLNINTRIEYTKQTKEYFPLQGNSDYFTNVSYPFVSRQMPISLVKSVFHDAGFYGAYEGVVENKFDYTFKKFTWANLGRGTLGFQEVVVKDIARNTISSQFAVFNNDKFLLLPWSTSVSKNNITLSTSRSLFEVKNLGDNRFGIYPKFTENYDNLTGQNLREDYSYQETYTDSMGGVVVESTYHIGKPIKKIINKGFYRHFLNFLGIDGALETITESYSYPSPTAIVIGDPIPFHRYFLPNRVQTTAVRKGQDPFSTDVRFVYNNAKGWVTKKRDNYGSPHAVTTDYTYNTFGNLITQTTSSSGCPTISETIEYDPTNRFVKSRYNTAYPLLKSTSTYNGYTGWLNTSMDNVNGITQTFAYDGFGRATSVTDNTGLQKTTTITPPEQGSTDDTRYTVAEFNNITNKHTWKNYDRLGRLSRTIRFDFNGDLLYEDITYNGLGQVMTSSLPYKASDGTPIYTSTTYDNFGRQNQINAPNGTTLISYNLVPNNSATDNLARYTVTKTGTDGVPRATTNDAAGKKVQASDPGGNLDYTYHSSGKLLTTVLNGSMVTSSVYNGAGREVEKYDLNYGTHQYTYDNYGQLKTETDPKSNQYVMDYDALGNLVTRTGPEGVNTYTYNLNTAGFSLGKLTGITAPGGISESYSYGSFGRLTQEVKTIDGISFTNAYAYDGFGRLARKYFANFIQGITLNMGYNANDGSYERTYLNGGTIQNPKNLYSVLKKNVLGQATLAGQHSVSYSGTMPNSNENPSYKFNVLKQISSWGHLQYTSTTIPNSGGYYHEYSFEFNNADGKLNSRTNHFGLGEMEFFEYDNLNRLQSHFIYGATSSEIDYAQNGNISQKSDAGTFTYSSANKVAEIAPFTNIPSVTQTITYTPFDKVTTITEGNVTAHFKYWPDGQRAKMELKNNGVTYRTKYYMEDFEREIINGATRDLVYVRGEQDQYVAVVERVNNSNEKTYSLMTDYLGSVERIVDNNTLATVAYNNYDAWGRERNPNDWSYLPTTRNSNGWDRGFTGHEHIPEFGLINMNGRLYDPVLGRMLSPDPYIMGMDNTQGYNRYTYAMNNPLIFTDPSGEFVWAPVIIGAIMGAYMGGTMANNDFNLFNWDYSSGKTWGYMGAGALVGGASGAVGSAILSTGAPLSNTMSIIASSYLNSIGTAAYNGSQTDVGFSFGVGSINLTKNEIRGLWNWKDLTLMEKFGYTAGALANIQDAVARTYGADVTVKARPKLAGHSEINGKYKTDEILISVGPNGDPYPNANGMKWEYKFFQLQMKGTPYSGENSSYINTVDPQIKTKLFNIAGDLMTKWTNKLNSGEKLIGSTRLTYGLNNGCVNFTSRALLYSGVVNVNALLPLTAPVLLNLELAVRNYTIYAIPFLVNQ